MKNEGRYKMTLMSGVKKLFDDESYQIAGEHSETEDSLWLFAPKCSGDLRVMTSN